MLGIHRVGSGRAAYYASDLATELPVGTAGPTWAGRTAAALGLEGPVEPEAFAALLQARHPLGGHRLGPGRATVAAFDLTFTTPKSVSVLFALGGEDTARRIVAAHGAAVAGALSYLEGRAVGALRQTGAERQVVQASGVAAASFTHAVNRNHDPHLHSHVVMANLVHGSDGRWSACDGRGLAAHRDAASAVYDAHLRHELTRAFAVRWARGSGRAPEIDGIPFALVGEFSSRGAEIRLHRHDRGAGPGRSRRSAWAATRAAKVAAPPFAVLAAEWRARAAHAGAGEGVKATLRRGGHGGRDTVDEHAFGSVLHGLPHRGAYRRDVVRAFATAAPDGVAAAAVERLTDLWVPGPERGGRAIGVTEPLYRPADVIPSRHLAAELGPRPLDPIAHEIWRGAARAIEHYRDRWGLRGVPDALGLGDPPAPLAALGVRRLADHVGTVRIVDDARARLGRREPPMVDLSRGR